MRESQNERIPVDHACGERGRRLEGCKMRVRGSLRLKPEKVVEKAGKEGAMPRQSSVASGVGNRY